jgi:hypothetical protein
MTIVGEFSIKRPAGVDNSVAYCNLITFLTGPKANESIVVCQAALSRGHLVALIGVFDKTRSLAFARLQKVVPLAATGLTASVPST